MKKLLLALSVCFISVALNAQKADTPSETKALKKNMSLVDAVANQNPPANARGIIIYFGKTYSLGGCRQAYGLCIIWNKTKEELATYRLLADEAKGQAWAQNDGSGATQIVYNLPQVNLSTAVYSKMILKKKYTFAEDTYVPAELIAKLYKEAGIKDVPAQLKIAKGDYPVIVEGTPSAERRIRIKVTITNSKGGVVPQMLMTTAVED